MSRDTSVHTGIESQNDSKSDSDDHSRKLDSDNTDGEGFPQYDSKQFDADVKSVKANEDAGADKDTDSDSEDSADSNEDAPPSEGAGDTDFVKTTPQASRFYRIFPTRTNQMKSF